MTVYLEFTDGQQEYGSRVESKHEAFQAIEGVIQVPTLTFVPVRTWVGIMFGGLAVRYIYNISTQDAPDQQIDSRMASLRHRIGSASTCIFR
jgi:hypothetical protein